MATTVHTSPAAATEKPGKGDHLCVLVHGLWGNPSHLQYVRDALRARYDSSVLRILVVKRNAGRKTYDGIETGGERMAKEIENALEEYARDGGEIRKISIVGYSLGGLVSRYAIGLLYSKGYFQRIKPVNFTTFASPYLGVRNPLSGFQYHLWNVLGARTLSASGRQLFMIDKFRGTDRPLLSVLADKDSVFIKGLALFENRVLYANIANDRSTTWYTSSISKFNPFADLSAVTVNYLPKYASVVIDPNNPVSPTPPKEEHFSAGRGPDQSGNYIFGLPAVLIYAAVLPIAVTIFLVNAMLQTMLSIRRIKLHCTGDMVDYRSLPLLAEEVQETTDQVIENMHHKIEPQHLPPKSGEQSSGTGGSLDTESSLTDSVIGIKISAKTPPPGISSAHDEKVATRDAGEPTKRQMEFPTLALTPAQLKMIHNLDSVGFRKFPVHIHNDRHSHAAIIVRKPQAKKWFEGKLVISHWLDEVFVA